MKPPTVGEWTIKRLRDYLGVDCHTSDHVLDVLAKEIEAQLAGEREANNDWTIEPSGEKDSEWHWVIDAKTSERLFEIYGAKDTESCLHAHNAALAAERERCKEITQTAHAECSAALAAWREKWSQEKVREYFELLAAERAKWNGLE